MFRSSIANSTFPLHSIFPREDLQVYIGSTGYVFYKSCFFYWIVAGDPLLYSSEGKTLSENQQVSLKDDVLRDFLAHAKRHKKRVAGYYFSYKSGLDDFKTYELGKSYYVSLKNCHSMVGKERAEHRRAFKKANLFAYKFKELCADQNDLQLCAQVQRLASRWDQTKGFFKIYFLLSRFGLRSRAAGERWFSVYCKEGRLVSFISLLPYGRTRYYVDQMYTQGLIAPFAMDYLLLKTSQVLSKESEELCLGLVPFQDIKKRGALGKALGLFSKMNFFYNSHGLKHFKKKHSSQSQLRYLYTDKNPLLSLFFMGFVSLQKNQYTRLRLSRKYESRDLFEVSN